MNEPETSKRWERTKVQNLVRHESGRYYARLFRNGKEVWKSLKTSHLSVARAKLAELIKQHRENQNREIDTANGKLTFGEAATLHLQQLETGAEAKRRTIKYYRELLAALYKHWKALPSIEIRRISPQDLKEWATRYAKVFSASRYNGTLSLLRAIFAIAVESGVIFANPAAGLVRRAQKAKRLELPTRAQFSEFVAAMRTQRRALRRPCPSSCLNGVSHFGGRRDGMARSFVRCRGNLCKRRSRGRD